MTTMVSAAVHHTDQLWPTLTRVATAIAAVAGSVAAVVGTFNRSRLIEVHGVVNGRFEQQVQELQRAASALASMTAERDAAQAVPRTQINVTPPQPGQDV